MGLGARDATVVGTPLSCALAAAADNLPPCRLLFGGAGASRVPGAAGLPRAGAMGVFPGMLPHSTLGTPTLSRVLGFSREGVGARRVAPPAQPGELGRAGDLDGGGCIPKGVAAGSCVLQGERPERGQGATTVPPPPSGLAAPEGREKIQGWGKNCSETRRFGARSISAPLTCPKGPSGAALAPGEGWHPVGDPSPLAMGWQGTGDLGGCGTPRRRGAGGSASG